MIILILLSVVYAFYIPLMVVVGIIDEIKEEQLVPVRRWEKLTGFYYAYMLGRYLAEKETA